jgi:hypothetical protein
MLAKITKHINEINSFKEIFSLLPISRPQFFMSPGRLPAWLPIAAHWLYLAEKSGIRSCVFPGFRVTIATLATAYPLM